MDIKKMIEAKKQETLNALANNEAFIEASVDLGIREDTITTLNSLLAQCEEVVEQNPVMSASTRKPREFHGSRLFGYGNVIDALYQLLSGIQYASKEHKPLLLAVTGLSEALVEALLEAFGTLPYYSPRQHVVVAGTPMDVGTVTSLLQVVSNTVKVVIDTTPISQAKADTQFRVAKARAEQAEAEAEATMALQELALEV